MGDRARFPGRADGPVCGLIARRDVPQPGGVAPSARKVKSISLPMVAASGWVPLARTARAISRSSGAITSDRLCSNYAGYTLASRPTEHAQGQGPGLAPEAQQRGARSCRSTY
jgi:hypothetical protein